MQKHFRLMPTLLFAMHDIHVEMAPVLAKPT